MRGDLAANGIQIVGVDGFERCGDLPMNQAAPRGAQSFIGGVADTVVAEVVAIVALIAHDAVLQKLVQGADQRRVARTRSPRRGLQT